MLSLLLPVFLAQRAVPAINRCPIGWYATSGYCVPASSSSASITPRIAPCPIGWYASGAYCVSAQPQR